VKYLRASRSIFGEERTPDLVIGDMDTLSPAMQKKYSEIIVKVEEQEHNDQTKAVRWALENIEGLARIYIIGTTGGRLDHTIGNASLLMEYSRMFDLDARGIYIEAVTDNGSAFAVNDTTEFDCGIGRQVSIFSPDNSLKIRSTGLEYPTDEVVFDNWWKATLNNAVQDTVKLEFNHPSMALVFLN
jgi:thiamine pyrophosphokinase